MKLKYFDIGKELSKFSDHHQHKLGAVIVKKNRVISLGYNQLKTHTKSKHPFNSLHAEMNAILKADKASDLKGAEIYVYRQSRNGLPANAKPCIYCQTMLKEAGIVKINYTDNEFAYVSEPI